MKLVSTSFLAKQRNIDPKQLFNVLNSKGWIYKKENQWHLTKDGKIAGGEMKYNPKFGEYIVWPSDINLDQRKFLRENSFWESPLSLTRYLA